MRLDTRFPRPAGDAGEPASWGRPVELHVVQGAFPSRIVSSAQALRAANVLPAFVEAVRGLAARGVAAVTTSCGFLVLLQEELQAAVDIPVVTSSLLLLPGLLEGEESIGVLTISEANLGDEHLLAAGVARSRLADVVVQGVDPSSEFATAILGNRETMDVARARQDVVQAALALKARAPGVRTLVLECTNMPPYAQAVRDATGWRVLSLFDAVP
ncbi:aspartate/glutamate racemase family protein [Ramlibacter albus]|uniref:Aspartate/glutamate racemase family protein n=1 Tax=Ramlibacter albus TaxID=2079448 RepID=A0A923MCI5_9BURK|nr:aspartate/glutamate racemase family protein [Ramlibacter albus]